ncbi:MAG: hypothetical protein U0414_22450 [Polyangiaceae bacterium]
MTERGRRLVDPLCGICGSSLVAPHQGGGAGECVGCGAMPFGGREQKR